MNGRHASALVEQYSLSRSSFGRYSALLHVKFATTIKAPAVSPMDCTVYQVTTATVRLASLVHDARRWSTGARAAVDLARTVERVSRTGTCSSATVPLIGPVPCVTL